MERWLVLGSLVVMGAFGVACGSDDDDSSGTGGTSSGGGGSGGSAGSSSGGSSGGSSQGVTCQELCAQVFPLGCDKGPPSEVLCVGLCQSISQGSGADAQVCADAFNAVLACESTDSDMSCASDGYVTSTNCAAEWTALNPCLPAI
jgi:hypothetical protein